MGVHPYCFFQPAVGPEITAERRETVESKDVLSTCQDLDFIARQLRDIVDKTQDMNHDVLVNTLSLSKETRSVLRNLLDIISQHAEP